jgi:DNA-directed RNA polymerase I subunit RPA12
MDVDSPKAHKIGLRLPLSLQSVLSGLLKTGSLLFCPDCGTLLDLPNDEEFIKCDQCGRLEPTSCMLYTISRDNERLRETAYDNIEVTTRSHPDAFPSALKEKRTTQTKVHETYDASTFVRIFYFCSECALISGQTNDVKCARCEQLGAYYTQAQTRSADEGSTIFYTVRGSSVVLLRVITRVV